jgi:very-short-patch-repair endonuclease
MAIETRLANGLLLPLHRGVYAVGHRELRRQGYWLAAVLAAGPGAVLSHRDAAGLHDLRPANHAGVDVTTAADRVAGPGVHVYRTRTLEADDVTRVHGVPVTSVARTLVDLVGFVPPHHVRKALQRAEELQTLDVTAIEQALDRTRGRRGRGHAMLRAALAEYASLATSLTRSSLEVAFLELLRRAGLPIPSTNVLVENREVDAVWSAAKLIVELDGWAYHRSRQAFERDRERDVALTEAGYRVIRFTHRQVTERPERVAAALTRLLQPR